jgi:hypothetical protein
VIETRSGGGSRSTVGGNVTGAPPRRRRGQRVDDAGGRRVGELACGVWRSFALPPRVLLKTIRMLVLFN